MGSRSTAERLFACFFGLGVLLVGCTGAPTEPVEVDDCGGLTDVGVELVEGYLDVVEQLDARVFTSDAPIPDELADELADLDRRSAELDGRMQALACDPSEVRGEILDRTEGLDSEDLIGQIMLRFVRDLG
ncbi:MAG: hypothetical protein KJN71_00580 [Acidimicrobiia bacterium]|nr:hypothetical protein [Acidimicrobiia bacterium]NNC75396.1 hypothetical protein [Acidimicrobiia bacterium]